MQRNERHQAEGRSWWGGLAAMAGGGLGILLTPVFASAYLESAEESPTALVDAFRTVAGPLLDFDDADAVYQTYGRLYLLAAGLMLLGLLALRDQLARRIEGTRSLTVSLVGWALFMVGLIGDYGIGDALGDGPHDAAFAIEALGLLILLIGALLLGIAAHRTRRLPRWAAWPLILALPLAFVGLLLISHIPSGPMFGVSAAWVALGYAAYSGTLRD